MKNNPKQIEALVRKYFKCWQTKDKETLEKGLDRNFKFSSPNGENRIGKQEYFKKCWTPGIKNEFKFKFLNILVKGDDVFVRYEAQINNKTKFQNTEYIKFKGEKLVEVRVFFGS